MTLLEVVIAMTLFSVIALYLMRVVAFNVQYRQKVTRHTHSMRLNRSIVQVFRKDFRNLLLIKPKDINHLLDEKARLTPDRTQNNKKCNKKPLDGDLKIEENLKNNELTHHPDSLPTVLPDYDKNCQKVSDALLLPVNQDVFLGKPNEVRFFSLSYVRTAEGELAGDENQIRYHIQPCEESSLPCLWRDMFLGRDFSNSDPINSVVLLKNIKTFKVFYFNIFDNQWKDSWLDKALPVAVKFVLEFQNNKKQWVKEEWMFPIHHRLISLRLMNQK